ncbi:MAG: hypothetical protein K2X45_18895, partial [Phreatobacter sp.]|nr:hypothetical protein [Phreatobacter sp.]
GDPDVVDRPNREGQGMQNIETKRVIARDTITREAHTTATEAGTTIPAHDKPVETGGTEDVQRRTVLKEAHSTATEVGTTIPAHDRLVPKGA